MSDGVKIRLSIAANVCLAAGSLLRADLFFIRTTGPNRNGRLVHNPGVTQQFETE